MLHSGLLNLGKDNRRSKRGISETEDHFSKTGVRF